MKGLRFQQESIRRFITGTFRNRAAQWPARSSREGVLGAGKRSLPRMARKGLCHRAVSLFRPGYPEFRQGAGLEMFLGQRKDDAFLLIEVFSR